MNYSPINLTKVGLFLTAVSSLFLIAKPSQAVIANLSTTVGSSNFTGIQGQVNAVPGTNDIDNATGTAGFDNFFGSSDFLLLGATTSNTNITTDSFRGGNSIAESSIFSLSQANIDAGIAIDFNWAFDGNSTGAVGNRDNFSIILTDGTSSAAVFDRQVNTTLPGVGYGSGSESVSLTAIDFDVAPTPGNYQLLITLNENGNATTGSSSAAGFNQISVAAVPFEFSPSQGLLAVGGLWGISAFLKRRKAAAMLNSDLAS
jgi:hypothetical protein